MEIHLLSDLFSGLLRFIYAALSLVRLNDLLGRTEGMRSNMFPVKVKCDAVSVIVLISPEWNVAKVKEVIAEELNKFTTETLTKPEEISVIFAGKKLPDSLKLGDSDLGLNSVIHAVKIIKKNPITSNDDSILAHNVIGLNVVDRNMESTELMKGLEALTTKQPKNKRRSLFFVYCPTCKAINSGKLRVRCESCKEDTLILSKDPGCWTQVLESKQISGTCQNLYCDGTYAEFYFKCASDQHKDGDNISVGLPGMRYNNRSVPCLACMDVSDVVIVFPCKEAHVVCYDCFKSFCLSKLNERQFVIDEAIGYTLSCPVGCENSLIKETHHFRVMGEEAYGKYQRFATEEFILKSNGIICPQPNCGAGMILDAGEALCDKITCESCSYVFCRHCRQGYHIGECSTDSDVERVWQTFDASVDPNQASVSRWTNELSLKAIRGTTKPCPKCRTPTERDGGCMHITCTRAQCGFEWCWICQTQWSRNCMADHWFD